MSAGTVSRNHSSPPRVIIDEMVYQKIMHWVNKSEYEVSGLGKLIIVNGDIRIIEAMLLPQKNTSTTTDIDPVDVGKLYYEMRDAPGEIRFWWHSHVNMNVFWSGTDISTINVLAQGGWYVSTVFNKRRETKTCIAMTDPFPIMYDDIPLVIERVLPHDIVKGWDSEYEKKVVNMVPKPLAVGKEVRAWNQSLPPKFANGNTKKFVSSLMNDDEEDDFPFGMHYGNSAPDLDWPGLSLGEPPVRRRKSELAKGADSPSDVLDRRDRLDNKLTGLERKAQARMDTGRDIPEKLQRAIDMAQTDLDEAEDECDQLVLAGMLDEDRLLRHRGITPTGE